MALSVLIVDDSPVMRTFIRRVMLMAGFEEAEYVEATDGEDALAKLSEHYVDLILTDINMPRMNGEDLLRAIEDDEDLRRIPAVVISTDATRDRAHRMLTLGARGYITKPFTPEVLREELDRVLGEINANAD